MSLPERRGTRALEAWARRATSGYEGVTVTNMSTAWRDGLAFCALIHHFRPDLIEFSSLKPENILENNSLAFRVAEQQLGIPALLDAEDMVDHPVPDRLSVLTYVSQFYRAFSAMGLLATGKQQQQQKKDQQQGQGVMSSPAPAKSPATPPAPRDSSPRPLKPKTETKTDKVPGRGGWGRREVCVSCQNPVFLAERLLVGAPGQLMHRTCFRCARCSTQLTLAGYYQTERGQYCCETCPDEERAPSPAPTPSPLPSPALSAYGGQTDSDSDSSSEDSGEESEGPPLPQAPVPTPSPKTPRPRTVFLSQTLDSTTDADQPTDQHTQKLEDKSSHFAQVSPALFGTSGVAGRVREHSPDPTPHHRATKALKIEPPGVLDTGQDRSATTTTTTTSTITTTTTARATYNALVAAHSHTLKATTHTRTPTTTTHTLTPTTTAHTRTPTTTAHTRTPTTTTHTHTPTTTTYTRTPMTTTHTRTPTTTTHTRTPMTTTHTRTPTTTTHTRTSTTTAAINTHATTSIVAQRLKMFREIDSKGDIRPQSSPAGTMYTAQDDSTDVETPAPHRKPNTGRDSLNFGRRKDKEDDARSEEKQKPIIPSITLAREATREGGTDQTEVDSGQFSSRQLANSTTCSLPHVVDQNTSMLHDPSPEYNPFEEEEQESANDGIVSQSLSCKKESEQVVNKFDHHRQDSDMARTQREEKDQVVSHRKDSDTDESHAERKGLNVSNRKDMDIIVSHKEDLVVSHTEESDMVERRHTEVRDQVVSHREEKDLDISLSKGSDVVVSHRDVKDQVVSQSMKEDDKRSHRKDTDVVVSCREVDQVDSETVVCQKQEDREASNKDHQETHKEPHTTATTTGPEIEYPDDLNPFGSEDEDSAEGTPAPKDPAAGPTEDSPKKLIKVTLNPFDSDDDKDDAEHPPKKEGKKSLNPFWSEDEEEEEEKKGVETTPKGSKVKPPRPPPPTLPRNSPGLMTLSPGTTTSPHKKIITPPRPSSPLYALTPSSPGGSMVLRKKGRRAPAPPQGPTTPRSGRSSPADPDTRSLDTVSSGDKEDPDEVLNWKMQKDLKNHSNKLNGTSSAVPPPKPSRTHLPSLAASGLPRRPSLSKSEAGEWKRKKGPAPPRPVPQKRALKKLPMKVIQQELQDIEIKQTELERQGVLLETSIRKRTETSPPSSPQEEALPSMAPSSGPNSIEVEDMIMQLFELVNEKNELFRRQTELMYLKREKRLEEEYVELEYQIRCLMLKAPGERTEEDNTQEEELIARLVKVVEHRDEIINCLELDRLREAQEDESIATHMMQYQEKHIDGLENGSSLPPEPVKKKKALKLPKKKKKEKKASARGDADKDVDETETPADTKKKKKKKKWLF